MAAKKRGLGLGLDSLITDKGFDTEVEKKVEKENVFSNTSDSNIGCTRCSVVRCLI